MFPSVINPTPARPKRGRANFAGCLSILVLLVIIIGAIWLFIARPYLHNIAQDKLDSTLSTAVNQIPPQVAALPPGSTLKVQENFLNNLFVLNTAPSSPVQHTTAHITPENIRIDFQLYGQPCAITQVPKAVNGHLVATNVTTEGIISLVMSPDELTALLNKHYADALSRIQHQVKATQLNKEEMDVILV